MLSFNFEILIKVKCTNTLSVVFYITLHVHVKYSLAAINTDVNEC